MVPHSGHFSFTFLFHSAHPEENMSKANRVNNRRKYFIMFVSQNKGYVGVKTTPFYQLGPGIGVSQELRSGTNNKLFVTLHCLAIAVVYLI
jgi:hypothetical protein